jgi:TPR repeat protein
VPLLPKPPAISRALQQFTACVALSFVSCATAPVPAPAAALEPSCDGAGCGLHCDKPEDTQCAELAHRYELGAGVQQDYAAAARLYASACSGGAGEACTRLAIMYDIGLSVPESTAQAIALYEQACTLGEAWPCSRAQQLQHAAETRNSGPSGPARR